MSANAVNTRAVKWARIQATGGPADKAVLLILAAAADASGSCGDLSTRTIAERADTNQARVRRVLDRLRLRGLVSWSPGAGHATNTYQLPL